MSNNDTSQEQIKAALQKETVERQQIEKALLEQALLEKALRESEARFWHLVNSTEDIVFTLDCAQRHTGVYGPWVAKSGLAPGFFLGKTARELYGDAAAVHEAANLRALAGEYVLYDWSLPGAPEPQYFQTSLSPMRDPEGRITGLVGIGRNITAHRRSEEALRASEASLKKAQQIARLGSWIYHLSGEITWSEEMYRIFGLASENFTPNAVSFINRIHPDDRPAMQDWIAACAAGEKPGELVFRIIHPNGKLCTISGRGELVRDADGQPLYLAGTGQDISERKQAEQRIRYLMRLYATLSQVNQAIVRVTGRQELFELICQIAVDFGEFRLAWIGLVDPDGASLELAASAGTRLPFTRLNTSAPPFSDGLAGLALSTGQVQYSSDIVVDPRMAHWRAAAWQDGYHAAAAIPLHQHGQVIGLLNLYAPDIDFFTAPEEQSLLAEIGLDISFALDNLQREAERLRAEAQLNESRKFIDSTAAMIPDIVYLYNLQEQRHIYFNREVESLLGYSNEEIQAAGPGLLLQSIHPQDVPGVLQHIELMAQTEDDAQHEVEYRIRGKQGGYLWFYVRERVYQRDAANRPEIAFGIVQDITARKQVEETLRAQDETLRQSETSLKFSQRVAHVGNWTWDTRTNRVTWSDEMYRIFGLDPLTFDGDLAHIIAEAIHPDDREKVQASNQAVVEQRRPEPLEYRVIWPDQSVHTVWAEAGEQVRDEQGHIVKLSGIVQDITARKQAEEQIKQSLAEKVTLLRELHHRTKNNMAVIIALLELQADSMGDDRLKKAFNEAKNRIHSMALVHQKLYDANDLSRLNLKDYINDLALLLVDSYSISTAQIAINLEIEDVFVVIDTAIPCGLIVNELISNALKYAFPDGRTGALTVRLQRTQAGVIELRIADDGVGVPPGFDFRRDGSLGMQNVYILGEGQLQGQVKFDTRQGVACQVTFRDQLYRPRV